MNILYILLAIIFISKTLLHQYVGNKNGKRIYVRGNMDSSFKVFLWFYNEPVSEETKWLKKICNILFVLFLILLFLSIIMSFYD